MDSNHKWFSHPSSKPHAFVGTHEALLLAPTLFLLLLKGGGVQVRGKSLRVSEKFQQFAGVNVCLSKVTPTSQRLGAIYN